MTSPTAEQMTGCSCSFVGDAPAMIAYLESTVELRHGPCHAVPTAQRDALLRILSAAREVWNEHQVECNCELCSAIDAYDTEYPGAVE